MARPPKGERLDQEEVSAELEIFPQDRERAEQGIRTLNAYEVAAAELEAVGQLQAAARLRLDAQKEQRKLRSLGCDNPAVLQVLKRFREEEEAQERKRQRLLHEEAGNRQSLAAARAAVAATDEVLRQKKKGPSRNGAGLASQACSQELLYGGTRRGETRLRRQRGQEDARRCTRAPRAPGPGDLCSSAQ